MPDLDDTDISSISDDVGDVRGVLVRAGVVPRARGPQAIADYIAPASTRAAAHAGRPAPRIVASIIVSVTAEPDGTRERIAARLGAAGQLPSYRSILDRQGKSAVKETIIAGVEHTVEQAIRAYADAGATELVASMFGDEQDQMCTRAPLSVLRTSV